MPESKYDIAKQFTAGYCAALLPAPCELSETEHWRAGYYAGFAARKDKGESLNKYLASIGAETMATIRLCKAAETIKVRIAVAVDPNGAWAANGYTQDGEPVADWDRLMDVNLDFLQSGEARYWIEAELPVPSTAVVQGEVSDA